MNPSLSSGQANDNPWAHAIDVAAGVLAKAAEVNIEVVKENVETPPDSALGDIATTLAFRLAKERKENPAKIAADIAGNLKKLVDSKDLLVELKPDQPSRMILKGTYGQKINETFGMSRQGVRWRGL